MPRNSQDLVSNPTPAILLVGDSGTHKTRFLATCPKPYVFDFDNGMATTRDLAIEYDLFKDMPRTWKRKDPADGQYEFGHAWPAFVKQLNEVGKTMDEGTNLYLTLGLDSLTTMGDICMNYVLFSDGHNGSPQIQHWGSQIQLLQSVLDQLTSWPITKVVTAHVQRNTNDVTQVIEQLPLVTGKLAGKVGIYFDEVYFCKASKSDEQADKRWGRKWTLTTSSTAMEKQAKSRYGVPDGTATTWQAVSPYITGKKT